MEEFFPVNQRPGLPLRKNGMVSKSQKTKIYMFEIVRGQRTQAEQSSYDVLMKELIVVKYAVDHL